MASEPVVYYWPAYIHAVRLVPLLALLLLLVRKSNRVLSTYWMLPAVAVPLAFNWGLEKSGATRYIYWVHDSYLVLVITLVWLWLLSDLLINRGRIMKCILTIVILALAGSITQLSLTFFKSGVWMTYWTTQIAIVAALLIASALATILLTIFACRKQYSLRRFRQWLEIIIMPIGGSIAALIAAIIIYGEPLIAGRSLTMDFVLHKLTDTVLPAALGSGALFIAVAPFVALALWAPAYRKRFHAIFRLPGMDFGADERYNDRT